MTQSDTTPDTQVEQQLTAYTELTVTRAKDTEDTED